MKRPIMILISFLLLFVAGETYAQRVTDGNYQTVAHINSDGTIQDASYRTIGHIKSDGTVQDASYRTIGHLKSDGTVQNSSYSTIGHIRDDGTVQDGSYRTIGHTTPIEETAVSRNTPTLKSRMVAPLFQGRNEKAPTEPIITSSGATR